MTARKQALLPGRLDLLVVKAVSTAIALEA